MAHVPPQRERVGPVLPRWATWTIIGFGGGMLAGMFGVGGGIVMVPMLVALAGMPQRRASSTSLLAIVPIAGAAALSYAHSGSVDPVAGMVLLVGGVLGGQLGGRVLPRVRVAALRIGFGILSLLTAVRLFLPVASAGTVDLEPRGWALLLLAGLASGMLAALLGIGGGIIMVPALVLLAGADADTARGTSLLVVIGTALTATIPLTRAGFVDVRAALVVGLLGVPAGLLGGLLGQRMHGDTALMAFAGLLVYSGVRVLVQGLRGWRTESMAVH